MAPETPLDRDPTDGSWNPMVPAGVLGSGRYLPMTSCARLALASRAESRGGTLSP